MTFKISAPLEKILLTLWPVSFSIGLVQSLTISSSARAGGGFKELVVDVFGQHGTDSWNLPLFTWVTAFACAVAVFVGLSLTPLQGNSWADWVLIYLAQVLLTWAGGLALVSQVQPLAGFYVGLLTGFGIFFAVFLVLVSTSKPVQNQSLSVNVFAVLLISASAETTTFIPRALYFAAWGDYPSSARLFVEHSGELNLFALLEIVLWTLCGVGFAVAGEVKVSTVLLTIFLVDFVATFTVSHLGLNTIWGIYDLQIQPLLDSLWFSMIWVMSKRIAAIDLMAWR